MLVLSYRLGEKFLFPSLGVSVEVFRSRGSIVRLGIDASDDITILRGEIAATGEERISSVTPNSMKPELESIRRHAWQNRLNHLTLKLELLKRQLQAGSAESPENVLSEAIDDLSELENTLDDRALISKVATGRRVLIVEDQAAERELLADCLRLSGFEVVTVSDRATALDYLREHKVPDLVLLDMQMPGIDGPALVDAVRNDAHLRQLRVFAVSGSPKTEFPTTALAVDGWFPKPLRLDALLHAVNLGQDGGSNSV